MLSMRANVNLPAFVLSGCVLCALCLNMASWKEQAAMAAVVQQKQEVVTRLLVDR